jgi:hypothetical protein
MIWASHCFIDKFLYAFIIDLDLWSYCLFSIVISCLIGNIIIIENNLIVIEPLG